MRSFLILATFAFACLIGNNYAGVIKRDDGGGRDVLGILPIGNSNDILKGKGLKDNDILNGCGIAIGCKSAD